VNILVHTASSQNGASQTIQLSATAKDQFGVALESQPPLAWSSKSGTISMAGLCAAGGCSGNYQVTASAAGISGSATYTVAPLNIAKGAIASASSTGSPAQGMNDGVIDGYPSNGSKEWSGNVEKVGAWGQLTWSAPIPADR
jgi:hypothetical protein